MFGKRIGFLKFKADIFDKETGHKVSKSSPSSCMLVFLFSCIYLCKLRREH